MVPPYGGRTPHVPIMSLKWENRCSTVDARAAAPRARARDPYGRGARGAVRAAAGPGRPMGGNVRQCAGYPQWGPYIRLLRAVTDDPVGVIVANPSTFGTDSSVGSTVALLEAKLPAVRERRRELEEQLAAVIAQESAPARPGLVLHRASGSRPRSPYCAAAPRYAAATRPRSCPCAATWRPSGGSCPALWCSRSLGGRVG